MSKVKLTSGSENVCYTDSEIQKVVEQDKPCHRIFEVYFENAVADHIVWCFSEGLNANIPEVDNEEQLSEAAARGQAIEITVWHELCKAHPIELEVDLFDVVNEFMEERGIGDQGLAEDDLYIKDIKRVRSCFAALVKIMDEKISNSISIYSSENNS